MSTQMDIKTIFTGDILLYKPPKKRYAQRVTVVAVNMGKQRAMVVLQSGKTITAPIEHFSRPPKAKGVQVS